MGFIIRVIVSHISAFYPKKATLRSVRQTQFTGRTMWNITVPCWMTKSRPQRSEVKAGADQTVSLTQESWQNGKRKSANESSVARKVGLTKA